MTNIPDACRLVFHRVGRNKLRQQVVHHLLVGFHHNFILWGIFSRLLPLRIMFVVRNNEDTCELEKPVEYIENHFNRGHLINRKVFWKTIKITSSLLAINKETKSSILRYIPLKIEYAIKLWISLQQTQHQTASFSQTTKVINQS